MRCLESITDSVDMNFSELREMVEDREAWPAAVYGVAEVDTTYRMNKKNRRDETDLVDLVHFSADSAGKERRKKCYSQSVVFLLILREFGKKKKKCFGIEDLGINSTLVFSSM